MRSLSLVLMLTTLSTIACAPAATTIPPGHMSAKEERATARAEERSAGVLERQAAMDTEMPVCGGAFANGTVFTCWTSPRQSGSAAEKLARATELTDAAVEHRRVSNALREAEARACAGVPEADVVESPFSHTADIVEAQVIYGAPGPSGEPHILGARVRFHSIEKLTAEWLQHVIDCHIARNDAMGHDVPEMGYCPLVPRGAWAKVSTIPHGYIVEVRSDVPEAARDIARRSLALTLTPAH